MIGKDLVQTVLIGGYPEMLRREDPKRRQTWARDYIRAIVQRDVREVADLEKLDQCRACCRFSRRLCGCASVLLVSMTRFLWSSGRRGGRRALAKRH